MKIPVALLLLHTIPSFLLAQNTGVWSIEEGGNGHRYEVITESAPLRWPDARDAATARGGYLATITSAEENAFLFALVGTAHTWLGAYQPPASPEPDGGWSWVTGEQFQFTNWEPSEPNNLAGQEHYLELSGVSGRWNDLPLNHSQNPQNPPNVFSYTVEYPLPSILSVATNPNNGHTYALLSDSSWEEAEAKARTLGGHLATIRSQAEQDWIWNRWGGSSVTLWIGLHNPTQDNTNWQWSSGEPVTYTSWGSGEPTYTHEVYVEMHWQKQGRWNDTAPNVITTKGVVEFTSPTVVMTPSSNPPPASSANAPVVFASTISSDGTFQFDIAAPEVFDELAIEVSSNLFDWHHLITMPVSTVPTTIKELRQGDRSRFYRVATDGPAANGRLTWPLPAGGPYTSRCVAIIDHSPTGDGQVIAYNGEVASGAPYEYAPGIIGYPKIEGGSFQLPLINYDDEVTPVSEDTYLFYDGHRGYDFPATLGTEIKAAAGGDLFAATDDTDGAGGGIWRNASRAARFASITYSWDTYKTFYIIHPSGLSTWYLHASALAPDVMNEIAVNGFAEVKRGDVIGYTGDTGTPGSYHLHFSSRRTTGTSVDGEFISEIADPYGDGSADHANVLWDKSPTSN